MVYEPLKVPEGDIDFTKLIKNISILYLSSSRPQKSDLDDWIVLPLYQNGQDLPITNSGKTCLLLATKDELDIILDRWKERNEKDKLEPTKKPITKRKGLVTSSENYIPNNESFNRKRLSDTRREIKELKKQLKKLKKNRRSADENNFKISLPAEDSKNELH